MRNLRFKSFFIALVGSVIETTLGKRCNSQTVGFSPKAASENTLVELTARWSPVVETLMTLLTASSNAKDFGANLSNDHFMSELAQQINALLHAMSVADKHAAFADLVTGT